MPILKSTEFAHCDESHCEKCLVLGITQDYGVYGSGPSHESLHLRHEKVLFFGLKDAKIAKSTRRTDSDVEEEIPDVDKKRSVRTAKKTGTPLGSRSKVVPKVTVKLLKSKWNNVPNTNSLINKKESHNVLEYFDERTQQFMMNVVVESVEGHRMLCKLCGKSITVRGYDGNNIWWSRIFDHARSHTGKKYFRCSMCYFECATKEHLASHRSMRHRGCARINMALLERMMSEDEIQEICQLMIACIDKDAVPNATGRTNINGKAKLVVIKKTPIYKVAAKDNQSASETSSDEDEKQAGCSANAACTSPQGRRYKLLDKFDFNTQHSLINAVRRRIKGFHIKCNICKISFRAKFLQREMVRWTLVFDHVRAHTEGVYYYHCTMCPEKCVSMRQIQEHVRCHPTYKYGMTSKMERKLSKQELAEFKRQLFLCLNYDPKEDITVGDDDEAEKPTIPKVDVAHRKRPAKRTANYTKKTCDKKVSVAKIADSLRRTFLSGKRFAYCRQMASQSAIGGQFICRVCSKLNLPPYVRNQFAYAHVLNHAKLLVYKCKYCSIRYYNSISMGMHVARKHQQPGQKNYIDLSDEFHDEIMSQIRECFDWSETNDQAANGIIPVVLE